MKKTKQSTLRKMFLTGLLPLIVWMSTIFFLSSRPRIPITENYVMSFAIFKTAHLVEYGILYALWLRFLTLLHVKNAFVWAFVATVLYALSDEWHQTFIPTREGKPLDAGIDALGALTMWWLINSKGPLRRALLDS